MRGLLLGMLALMALAQGARAETPLLDTGSLAGFHYESGEAPVRELSLGAEYASAGRGAICFRTPRWKVGMAEWPAFELEPRVRDWTGADRLLIDVTNPTGSRPLLALFITDRKVATRSGLHHSERLRSAAFQRIVIPLAALGDRGVSAADIARIHLFTERPPADMIVWIGRVSLLRAGEALPPVHPACAAQAAALMRGSLADLAPAWAAGAARVRALARRAPSAAGWTGRELSAIGRQVEAALALSRRDDAAALDAPDRAAAARDALAALEARATMAVAWERVRPAVTLGRQTGAVAGFASSMVKVLPRAGAPALRFEPTAHVSLARNEKEAFQLIVLPLERALRRVTVAAGELRGPRGILRASAIAVAPVGYVETKTVPPYGSGHVGWWPDPILEHMQAADIARGDAQAFWVRITAPLTQPPGTYTGRLTVSVDGRPAMAFGLTVRVFGFAVPSRSPLPLAITFQPGDIPTPASAAVQAEWRKDPAYPVNAWKRQRLAWADMLADHYITYDTLYPGADWTPDFEILQRLRRQGRLGRFNLAYYDVCPADPAGIAAWERTTLEVIRPRYERAKALDLLSEAYIYGCDENTADRFPGVQRAVERIKAAFPGVQVMTTTYDHTYGTGSVITAMDAWCPLTAVYSPERAEAARAAGRQVWWYICCGPHHPNANMFIEYPAIDGRVLMGAQTIRYRPDGFLYYQISLWNSRRPISSGPFTDWDPRSWTVYHGDGSWTCVGPGGRPLPTVRLENFRDGLEDYAYARILEATLNAAEAAGRRSAAWIARRRALLKADEVARSMVKFTSDPAVVYRWREAMAAAIEGAGVPAADPWKAAR